MAFCPECGKPVTPEASKCASCGHELEANPAAAKTGAARFKGTMIMATAPVVTKAENKAAANPAPAATPASSVAASPAAGPAVSGGKPQAKATMIGTGLGTAPGAGNANAAQPASLTNQAAPAKPVAAMAAKPATPVAHAGAPNAWGSSPKSTVIGAGIAPVAAAAAAHAAKPAAAAPIAAAAAGAVAQASAAQANQPGAAKPEDPKRNLAYAQTQHQAAFASTSQAAIAAAPRTSPNIGAATTADEAFDPHAETDPPEAPPVGQFAAESANDPDREPIPDTKYLPGDPMGPQTQPTAARAPMLRYDESIPHIARGEGQEKKWLWIAAGVIVIACLGLVIVLASRLGH